MINGMDQIVPPWVAALEIAAAIFAGDALWPLITFLHPLGLWGYYGLMIFLLAVISLAVLAFIFSIVWRF